MTKFNIFSSILLTVACSTGSLAQPGTLDPTYGSGTGINNNVRTSSIQNDGKTIVGGNFTSVHGTTRNHIARLNADGSLDGAFNPGTGANSVVLASATQIDGKVIIGGNFSSFNGTSRARIARLNANGSLDLTFTPPAAIDWFVKTIAIQADGKIILGGEFTTYNEFIIRLNADGSLDASFNPDVSWFVNTIAIQDDGKIIIGGDFTSIEVFWERNHIARLNEDGSIDGTFDPGVGANGTVETTIIQPDGKIIIGGSFTSYNATPRNRIARLNVDGSLDVTFDPGEGANGAVYACPIQDDEKIVIGGSFTSYDGTPRNRIARLNIDGSLDATFDSGEGANGMIQTASIQTDGRIVIGGDFIWYDETSRNRIARVIGGVSTSIETNGSKSTTRLSTYPNPTNGRFDLLLPNIQGQHGYELFSPIGRLVQSGNIISEHTGIDLQGAAAGIYILRVVGSNGQMLGMKRVAIQ
ncbi:MAG: T9SS type A sorting domain-containing protein [Flavobacteriales bacterium]|nr:T9SS type A sorting domain-containing protein [Flavobacteriales bacterium]